MADLLVEGTTSPFLHAIASPPPVYLRLPLLAVVRVTSGLTGQCPPSLLMGFAARSKLLECDRVAPATEGAGKGGLFCTGSGSLVPVSERSVKRARVLVEKEGEEEEATNITSKSSSTQSQFNSVELLRIVGCLMSWN
jgi:hypothetical protein